MPLTLKKLTISIHTDNTELALSHRNSRRMCESSFF